MMGNDLVGLLATIPPADLAAIELLGELGDMERRGILDHAALGLLQPDIEAAIVELNKHVTATREVVTRCRQLPPIPSATVPPGF